MAGPAALGRREPPAERSPAHSSSPTGSRLPLACPGCVTGRPGEINTALQCRSPVPGRHSPPPQVFPGCLAPGRDCPILEWPSHRPKTPRGVGQECRAGRGEDCPLSERHPTRPWGPSRARDGRRGTVQAAAGRLSSRRGEARRWSRRTVRCRPAAGDPGEDRQRPGGTRTARRRGEQGRVRQPLGYRSRVKPPAIRRQGGPTTSPRRPRLLRRQSAHDRQPFVQAPPKQIGKVGPGPGCGDLAYRRGRSQGYRICP